MFINISPASNKRASKAQTPIGRCGVMTSSAQTFYV